MILSLRLRLVLIILIPLLVIAALLGVWAVQDAQARASERFERSLLSAALAVSRDVAVSGGDALSPETNALLRDTSGGQVFYHVYAPDGVFVTGYATPPVPVDGKTAEQQAYTGVHQGEPVHALRFVDVMQVEGLSGAYTVTVWQKSEIQGAIVRDLTRRSFLLMSLLVLSVALVVWFGVRLGLRPLLDLETAIARRSSDELAPIRRKVPVEAEGIVRTLNGLLDQVSISMQAKDVFISNAAHQLRNPIAGISAMTEAVRSARTFDEMKERTGELAVASRHASDLANKLLTLERAKGQSEDFAPIGARAFLGDLRAKLGEGGVPVVFEAPDGDFRFTGDGTLLAEAVVNLVDNARRHGGAGLRTIRVRLSREGGEVRIEVADDGQGMALADVERAKDRFVQLEQSQGSGLGLAIAEAIALGHKGRLEITPLSPGLAVAVVLPMDPRGRAGAPAD